MEWEKELIAVNKQYTPLDTKGLMVSVGDKMVTWQAEKLFTAANLTKLPIYLFYYEKTRWHIVFFYVYHRFLRHCSDNSSLGNGCIQQ